MIQLGARVKDQITGFTGVVTGRVEYITGCHQVLVQPPCKPDGDYVENRWLDEDRVQSFPGVPLTLNVKDPGPDKPAPRR
jgi:hypothetical protein